MKPLRGQRFDLTDPDAASPSTRWLTSLVFILSLAYLLMRVPSPELFLTNDAQGYQMAMGMAVATGFYPGLDFITQYGPLVAVASWLAWVTTGNLVGEIFFSAAGYSAAVALTCAYLARHASVPIGLAGSLMLLALLPRFYKWYYWLLPMLTMIAAGRFAARQAARPRAADRASWSSLAALGLSVGVSGLFRYDLLVEGLVFGLIVIVSVESVGPGPAKTRKTLRDCTAFAVVSLVVPLAFAAMILALRGPHQLGLVLQSVIDGTADTVVHYLKRPYRFSLEPLISAENALALLQLLIPFVYVGAIALSMTRLRGATEAGRARGIFLLCASLMGLGIFPQALHRGDLQHLLQVMPPFVITLGLLLKGFQQPRAVGVREFCGIAGFAATLAMLLILVPRAGTDLGSLARNPVPLWEQLIGLPNSAPNDSTAEMSAAIQKLTPPDATVFLVMPQTRMSMLYFARRHQPGLFSTYERGMFTGPHWLAENEARLRRRPPDYLVIASRKKGRRRDPPAPYIPHLVAEWRRDYRQVVYQGDDLTLFARTE